LASPIAWARSNRVKMQTLCFTTAIHFEYASLVTAVLVNGKLSYQRE
jgi:hypothetical protein